MDRGSILSRFTRGLGAIAVGVVGLVMTDGCSTGRAHLTSTSPELKSLYQTFETGSEDAHLTSTSPELIILYQTFETGSEDRGACIKSNSPALIQYYKNIEKDSWTSLEESGVGQNRL